jgi:hypothetical protein
MSLRKLGVILTAVLCVLGISESAFAAKRARPISIDHIDVVAAPGGTQFGGIVPCANVLRPIWQAALAGQAYTVRFHFRYRTTSKKGFVVKNVVVPLKNMRFVRDSRTDSRYVQVDTVVNVANRPVKAGTQVKGKVNLKSPPKGKTRAGATFPKASPERVSLTISPTQG